MKLGFTQNRDRLTGSDCFESTGCKLNHLIVKLPGDERGLKDLSNKYKLNSNGSGNQKIWDFEVGGQILDRLMVELKR